MTRTKPARHFPWKPVVYALLALALGVTLLVFSQVVKPSGEPGAEEPAPAPAPESEDDKDAPAQDDSAARNLSGMLLLFSAAAFLLCVICIGWLVIEIRKARPAWKTQTKYPKMR